MLKAFRLIPEPLQIQILYRLSGGIALLLFSVVLFCTSLDFLAVLSCFAISLFSLIITASLFRTAIIGEYVVISGECRDVVLTAIRKRTKSVTLVTDDGMTFKVMVKTHLRKTRSGARITLYISANTPIYEGDDVLLLYSYLALEAK